MPVYKVLRPSEWDALRARGETPGSPLDVLDGFVHLSAAPQVAETLRLHFAQEPGLVLLALDDAALALRWEPSRGGEPFPHHYGPLRVADILWTAPLPLEGGRHLLTPL